MHHILLLSGVALVIQYIAAGSIAPSRNPRSRSQHHTALSRNGTAPYLDAQSILSGINRNLTFSGVSIFNETTGHYESVSALVNSSSARRRLTEANPSKKRRFQTVGCGASSLGSARAAALDVMLAKIQTDLRQVIKQARGGTASRYGFQALFKSSKNKKKVADLFSKIMNVDDINNDPEFGPEQPLTICVTPTSVQRYELLGPVDETCKNEPETYAIQPPGQNFVLLCPSFWVLPVGPLRKACPSIADGTLVPNEAWLQLNQEAAIIHEMVHIYLGGSFSLSNETYRIADAVALGEVESLLNPSNYAFFYSGTSFLCTGQAAMALMMEGNSCLCWLYEMASSIHDQRGRR